VCIVRPRGRYSQSTYYVSSGPVTVVYNGRRSAIMTNVSYNLRYTYKIYIVYVTQLCQRIVIICVPTMHPNHNRSRKKNRYFVWMWYKILYNNMLYFMCNVKCSTFNWFLSNFVVNSNYFFCIKSNLNFFKYTIFNCAFLIL
jgi:hypothetical protein